MATGDIWKVALIGSYDGNLVVVTSHWKAKSGSATGDGAAQVFQNIITNHMSSVCNDLSWTKRTSSSLTVPPSVTETGITVTGSGGANAGLPNQAAMVWSLKTGFAGRSYRGRLYFPGFVESTTTNGSFNSAIVTSTQSSLNTTIGTYGAAGTDPDYQWGVYSLKLGATRDGGGHITAYDLSKFYPFTAAIVRAAVGTQRRRRVGVGA